MSRPITQFRKTRKRAEALLDIHDQRLSDIAAGSPEFIQEDDLVRASVVMAVAAMDHYFTSKFCDVLVSHLKSKEPSKELVEMLTKAGLNTRVALEIVVMKRPFRRIRTMVQNHLSLYTSHRIDAIDKLFATMELRGLSGRAQSKLKQKNLLKRIDSTALLRNEIVHDGHINSRGNVKHIDPGKIRKAIDELEGFVSVCDALINSFVAGKT